ncbi:MAG TPA: D-alanyl-D-alanine carboxypeptidase/D-alanyl-D-alanine-endopeptidase [Polyangiales bacterium]|nr:D-alanyl-D-alanine carboxypeptidase/D-alanyl-D-alanine-endopeptidase [Polyangiales bacterium]
MQAQAAPAPAVVSQSAADTGQAIRTLIGASSLADKVSVSIIDLATGQTLVDHTASKPRNPASNMKLLTAATAMIELGPDFRMRTGLYGKIQDAAVSGGLCLQGRGDPTLTSADLMMFAQRLSDEGVRQVDELIVDGSYFDAQILPPSFDEQPNEVAPFRAAVAALSVNANAYTLRVRPGAAEGALAQVSLDASGYFDIDNGLTTTGKAGPNVIAAQRVSGDKLALSLRGTLPVGGSSLAYERRVETPLQYAGYAFIDALRALRIAVPKRVVVGTCPAGAPLITNQQSPPLSVILTRLGKESDNFVAEMVLKVIAAERKKRPARSADGVTVVLEVLKRLHVPTAGLSMVNGSGLFHGNQVSPATFASLLAAMYANPSLRDDFVAHLAVGGVDGTLVRRFRTLPAPRIVRAKTGTLEDVIALSGYVLGPTPGRAIAFSYLANGVGGKHGEARELIDKIVETLAAYLYSGK